MASSRLLTKILADFLFSFYLLNLVLKHATNHTQTRCTQAKNRTQIDKKDTNWNFITRNYFGNRIFRFYGKF